jgi:Ca-activated chloride channel family protein
MRHRFWNVLGTCLATAAVLAGLASVTMPVWAQESDLTVQVVQVDESRFPEIDVYVSVTDADGQPVTDLEEADFQLEENGERIELTGFHQAGEQGPVTAVLVIDKSGSMDYAGKMEAAREAAVAFVKLMRPGDSTGVIAFDTQVTIVQPLSDDQEALIAAIESIETGSDTALYDALHEATAMLETVSGRKAIIAVTDGMNTAGVRTLEETLALVDEESISVYTIGLGDPSQGTGDYSGIDEQTLQSIAEQSNGAYQFAPDPKDLGDLYETLSYRLQNEYKLTYQSPTPLRDGVKRDTTVSIVSSSGTSEVSADYNPGGVIPEVEQRPTGILFGFILAVLIILLILPTVVNKVRARATASDGATPRPKAKSPAKGRVRLTGDSGKKKDG